LAAAPVRQFSFQYLFFKMVFLKQPDALHCTAFFEEKKCLGCLTNHQAVRAVKKTPSGPPILDIAFISFISVKTQSIP
jgi:hypothetical protein